MVAPSFQSMTIVSDIYLKNGRTYVDVRNESTSKTRSVRWYNDEEYAKQYGILPQPTETAGFPGLKQARGFSDGPILVVSNANNSNESAEWLNASNARFATDIGWYFVSTEKLPDDIPEHFQLVSLTWEEFSKDETHAKTSAELKAIIMEKKREVFTA